MRFKKVNDMSKKDDKTAGAPKVGPTENTEGAEKAAKAPKAEAPKAEAPKAAKAAKWEPSAEAVAEKMRAGLTKSQAVEVLTFQRDHDATNPHD